jgi:hypothetical protein
MRKEIRMSDVTESTMSVNIINVKRMARGGMSSSKPGARLSSAMMLACPWTMCMRVHSTFRVMLKKLASCFLEIVFESRSFAIHGSSERNQFHDC